MESETMVGITGISGAPDTATTEQTQPRVKKTDSASPATKDSVVISPEAQHVAKAALWTEAATQDADLEQQRIAEARARLEEGVHRMHRVVQEVAARVSRYITIN